MNKKETVKKRTGGLGKGLGALLQSAEIQLEPDQAEKVVLIDLDLISPLPGQPRKVFNPKELDELAESIKQHGVLQPIILNRNTANQTYVIIAGERRWRAARLAGKTEIPAIVRNLDKLSSLQHAIIENIQRVDLNPLEEASAYAYLQQEYGMTQEELAERLGKSRSAIANSLRLNQLDQKVKDDLVEGKITAGHARCLLGLTSQEQVDKALRLIKKDNLNVRETEKLVQRLKDQAANKSRAKKLSPEERQYVLSLREVERNLRSRIGSRVELRDRKGKGQIVISYSSMDELNRLINLLENK